MKIKTPPRRNRRSLKLQLAALATETVSALDSCDWDQHTFGYSLLSPSVAGIGSTGWREIESAGVSRGTCRYDGVRSSLPCNSCEESS